MIPVFLRAFAAHAEDETDVLRKLNEGWCPADELTQSLPAAAYLGSALITQEMLNMRANLEDESPYGGALIQACIHAHPRVVETLLRAKADPKRAQKNGLTAIDLVRERGHLAVLRVFQDHNKNRRSQKRMTILGTELLEALWRREGEEEVARIIVKRADINARESDGDSALHVASFLGYAKVVQMLVRKNMNVDERNHTGWTPFLRACSNGHTGAVETLLALEADPNCGERAVQDVLDGRFPEVKAAVRRRLGKRSRFSKGADFHLGTQVLKALRHDEDEEVITELVRCKADACAKIHDEHLIHMAAARGYSTLIQALVLHHADVNAQKESGTPLDRAVRAGHVGAIYTLLANKATPDHDSSGKSALDMARQRGHEEVVWILEQILPKNFSVKEQLEIRRGASKLREEMKAVEDRFVFNMDELHERVKRMTEKMSVRASCEPQPSNQSNADQLLDSQGANIRAVDRDCAFAVVRSCLAELEAQIAPLEKRASRTDDFRRERISASWVPGLRREMEEDEYNDDNRADPRRTFPEYVLQQHTDDTKPLRPVHSDDGTHSNQDGSDNASMRVADSENDSPAPSEDQLASEQRSATEDKMPMREYGDVRGDERTHELTPPGTAFGSEPKWVIGGPCDLYCGEEPPRLPLYGLKIRAQQWEPRWIGIVDHELHMFSVTIDRQKGAFYGTWNLKTANGFNFSVAHGYLLLSQKEESLLLRVRAGVGLWIQAIWSAVPDSVSSPELLFHPQSR